ncbi:MAG: peptidoglycan DD-metalloendopeptidase family protein [Pseudomonadota bacterium]|nr:peptidoglycan DD-metalloendopeptidase family protein [Pseudomonadota bacterium]
MTIARLHFRSGTLLAAALILATSGGSRAQPAAPTPDPPHGASESAEERVRRERDLKALTDAMALSTEARRRLESEIAEIRTDRAKLNAALVETAERLRATEERVRTAEGRLQVLAASESAIRRSLDSRRALIVEVFAALQRMGLRPPPAVLVRPEDMLSAVRTSILLGAVLPELRAEADTLSTDLTELVRLRNAIAADQAVLNGELSALRGEQERVAALIEARQARLVEAERTAGAERERTEALARQAGTLKELIDRMEREITGAQRAAEEAHKAAEAQVRESRERFAQAAFRDPARLAPKLPFPETRGLLPMPVSGQIARPFGAADGYGGTTRGISVATRPKAVVVSPSDGWVAFAGPFRSFGRLLIINAGGGYYLLLAGMDQINVEVGQFVLAGEPVATMGEASSVSPAAGAIETKDPVLYIEFRKDGGSIDPSPWWAKSQSEKVRG